MDKDKYIALIYKQLKAEISSAEQAELSAWLDASAENRNLAERITSDWETSQHYAPAIEIDTASEFEKLQNRVREHKARQDAPEPKVVPMRTRRRWLKWVAAAAAFVITYIGVGYLMDGGLGIGTEWATVQTAANETRQVSLPDGSLVQLNEKSTFEYPVEFNGKKRLVKLDGEGYFDVTKDESKRFVIEVNEAKVSVLGTSFNLRAYSESISISLTVDEGRVRLQPELSGSAAIVNVGERGVYSPALGKMELLPQNDENESFWKTKTLTFTDRKLSEVLSTIRREMKVDVKMDDEYMEQCRLTGRFPNATPKGMLEHIADSFDMELVESSTGKYELSGGDCE